MKKFLKLVKKLDKKLLGGVVVIALATIAMTQVEVKTVYDAVEGGYGIQIPLVGWFVFGTMVYVVYRLQMHIVEKNEKIQQKRLARAEAMRKAKAQSYMKKAENISIY